MNIYKISIDDELIEEYDAFVIAADTASEALNLACEKVTSIWTGQTLKNDVFARWTAESKTVLIGIASRDVLPGIVLGSFNAG